MKKRFWALLVVCSMVLLFAGCILLPEPDPDPPPELSQLSEMKGKIVLLTLNPKPTKARLEGLGFNGQMPYAGAIRGWTGDYISITADRPGPVILRFTADEPDCRNHDPQRELARIKQMQSETPDILVGLVLCPVIGCNRDNKDEWLEVAQQADFVTCGIYAWHERYTNPGSIDKDAVAHLELMATTIERELDGVPFIPMLQGIWGVAGSDGNKIIPPNIELQVKFWAERGYEGYIVYCWSDSYHGVRDMQEEWGEWNKWFLSQIK